MRMRLGGYQGDGSVHTAAMKVLAGDLEAAGHAVAFTADITREGRNATDLFAMVEGEELEVCYFASSYLAGRVPSLGVFDLPFAVAGRERLFRLLDGELGDLIRRDVESATGFALLGFWDNGARHLTNAARALRTPADCEGLRIRTMDSALHQATFRALGFEPLYIDVKDYPAAVRDGTVDAQENPLTNIVNFSVEAVHKHLTMTGHFHGLTLLLGNRARLAGASAALGEAAHRASEAQRGFAGAAEEASRRRIEAAGVAVLDSGAFDRGAFAEATREVREEAARGVDPSILALLEG